MVHKRISGLFIQAARLGSRCQSLVPKRSWKKKERKKKQVIFDIRKVTAKEEEAAWPSC